MRASTRWHARLAGRYAPRHFHRGVVHLRNCSTEYIVVGRGEPIVLIPGLAGGYELAGRLIRVLSRHHQVISYQLRGEHNPHYVRQPHGLRELAEDLADLQSALLLERPTLLGISFGSAVALEFALRYGQRIGSLILNGMEASSHETLGRRIAKLALEQFPLPIDNPFFNQFFRLLFARSEPVGRLLDYVTEQCWSTDQSVMAHRLALLAELDARERLPDLSLPTLVIGGQEDVIVTEQRQRDLASRIPNSRFVSLTGAGHLCFLTRPKAFTRAVVDFLQTQHMATTQSGPAFA